MRTTQLITQFNRWITKHRQFALSIPIVLLLLIFFVVTTWQSMSRTEQGVAQSEGYNNFLPDQENELEVQDPNTLYTKARRDSLEKLNGNTILKNIVVSKNENDSLEQILQELDRFSLDSDGPSTHTTKNTASPTPIYVDKKTEAQEKLAYRKLLMEAREERQSRSQDYSAPASEPFIGFSSEPTNLKFKAAIYRDQFILPGSRVTLVLKEDALYHGKLIPKNTFIYALANVQGSRIVLDVTNIYSVQLSLTALDHEDGMEGLYNTRAGELMQEFQDDILSQGINEVSDMSSTLTDSPLSSNLIQYFGTFFKKKKYKQRDKILLVNGDRINLVLKK